MQLVNKKYDLALGFFDLVEDRLEPIFEFAAILCPGEHRSEVERHEALVLEGFGNIARDDPLGEALDDRGLADAGLAYQNRIILGPTRKYLNGPAYLVVAADDRIKFAFAGTFGQVLSIFLESLKVLFGVLVRDARASAKITDDLFEIIL